MHYEFALRKRTEGDSRLLVRVRSDGPVARSRCAPLHLPAGSVGEFCCLPADLHEMRMRELNLSARDQCVSYGLAWWGLRAMQAPRTFPFWLRDGVMLGGRSLAAKPNHRTGLRMKQVGYCALVRGYLSRRR
jgi:hypothetical protein